MDDPVYLPIRDRTGTLVAQVALSSSETLVLGSAGFSEDSAPIWRGLFRKIFEAGVQSSKRARAYDNYEMRALPVIGQYGDVSRVRCQLIAFPPIKYVHERSTCWDNWDEDHVGR
jgi:hypothetical protein